MRVVHGATLNSQIVGGYVLDWRLAGRRMNAKRVLSLDLDGTITDISFVNSVWLEGIPRLYAAKNCLAFEDAKNRVMSEYWKVGRERLEWYDLGYWIAKFGLAISSEEVLNSFQNRIRVFPEVPRVLKEFKNMGLRLIVVTNARREFVDLELEKTQIGHYFERVFSSTSDFGLIKKSIIVYRKVCGVCGISPEEMIHVGDDRCFDFDVPSRLGITSFYLDRTSENSGDHVVNSLEHLSKKLEALT
jgi:putative hydrolase of the HAD superfamily